jgi:hypothetical protein
MSAEDQALVAYIPDPPPHKMQCPECGFGRKFEEFKRPSPSALLICGSCYANWERLKRGDRNEKMVRRMALAVTQAVQSGNTNPTVGAFGVELTGIFGGLKEVAQLWKKQYEDAEEGKQSRTLLLGEFRKILAQGQQEARADLALARMTNDEMVRMLNDFTNGGNLALGFASDEIEEDEDDSAGD